MSTREKVRDFIQKEGLIQRGDRILLGLSGGADSVCLFYLLLGMREELGFELRAVHVHHGVRREADEDAAYAEELCEREGVSCYVFREDVPAYAREQGLSEEEAGRILRYRDFRECLENWKRENSGEAHVPQYKIATAHHENDQAETVLFQLFRGCGLSGLRGILPERGNIIRPLLCLSREEIEGYLREKSILWCEDRTNASEEYSRNKIRLRVLPYAEAEISRGAAAHIGKTARIVREAERYIRRQTEAVYRRIAAEREGELVLDIPALLAEDIFLQKQLILFGLERVSAARKDIGAVHVEDILKLLQKQGNGELNLPGRVRVKKVYQNLLILRESREGKRGIMPECSPEREGPLGAEEGVSPAVGRFLYGEKEPLFEEELIDLSDGEAVKRRFGIRDISEIMGCIPEKTYTKWFDYDKIETVFSFRHRESGDYLTIDNGTKHKSFRRYLMEEKVPASCREHIWLLADGAHVMWVPGGRMSSSYKITEQTKTILQIAVCRGE